MIFPVYNFYHSIFAHKVFSGGWGGGGGGRGASLLENWILEGDEQGNFPVNALIFLSIVFGLIFGVKFYE